MPATDAPPPPPSPDGHGWLGMPVELAGVGHRFGDVIAITDISLALPAGSLSGIIGPSGSGKTTTIRTITGGLRPERGEVRVLGEEPRHFRRRTRERIGYLPQQFVLYPDLTVIENIDFMASLYGLLGGRRRRRTHEVIRLVDLWDARGRKASDLSGGMQRRLALACALVHQPSLLVLDEPTAGIDPLLRTAVWQELARLRGEGVTVLVTTQYVTEAEHCDLVALISGGELIAWAPPEELRRQALGGEVLQVVTRAPVDARRLPVIEGVVDVRQTGPREMLVVLSQAGLASPRVMDALDGLGAEVEYSREYRPTFDDVFSALVTNHAAGTTGATPGGMAPDTLPLTLRRPR